MTESSYNFLKETSSLYAEAPHTLNDPNDFKSLTGFENSERRSNLISTIEDQNERQTMYPVWAHISSEILVHILSFLPRNEQLMAMLVCKHWRASFYHLKCWQTTTLGIWPLDTETAFQEKLEYHGRCLSRIRHLTFNFAADNRHCVQALTSLLYKASNGRLLALKFRQLLWKTPDFDSHPEWEKVALDFITALSQVCQQNPRLQELDFGSWNMLSKVINRSSKATSFFCKFVTLVPEMRHLQLLNVAADAEHAIPRSSSGNPFLTFRYVKLLALNALDLTSEFFEVFCTVESSIRLLVIAFSPKTELKSQLLSWSDPELWQNSWRRFYGQKPDCSIALVIYNSPLLNEELFSAFCCSWMRVTKLAFLNIKEGVGEESLRCFAMWGRSLHTVIMASTDAKAKHYLMSDIAFQGSFHSLIGCAWYCKCLRSLVVYGYKECADNLVGIARLAGPRLEKFWISRSSIRKATQFPCYVQEVSKALNRPWKPSNERSAKWEMFRKPPDDLPGMMVRHFMDEDSNVIAGHQM